MSSSSSSAFELPEPPALENFYEDAETSVHMIDVQCDVSFTTQTSLFNQENAHVHANTSFSSQKSSSHGGKSTAGPMRPSVANSDTTEPTVVAERL